GVRALPYAPGRAEGAITRRHLIHAHRDARGLYSIVGGKLTTYRALAREVLARLERDGSEPRRGRGRGGSGSPSGDEPLPGAITGAERAELEADLAAVFGARGAGRMLRTYGRLSARLVDDARARPELAKAAGPGAQLRVVELVHALESEWAESLVDLLQRRTMLGLDADFGSSEAPPAAAALVELGVWDDVRSADELAAYHR